MLCLCALVYLKDKNLINIEIEYKRSFWIFRNNAVIIKNTTEHSPNLYSIEKKVFENAIERKNVSDIVKSLISEVKSNPWDIVISIVRDDLIQKDYIFKNKYNYLLFFTRYNYIINQEKKPEFEKMISQTKQSLSIFKSYKDLYKETCSDIEYGFNQMCPSV